MYKVGFTGTSKGITKSQQQQVYEYLAAIKQEHPEGVEFHFGLCIGGDEQAAILAKSLGYKIIAHPGFSLQNPKNRLYRSDFSENDETREEKPFIKRDHDIVDESDEMIASPLSEQEVIRSGTWTTIRYARKQKKSINYAFP